MDVFALRDRLVDDYATYIKSFINIQDQRIQDCVHEALREGVLWPDPLIQLNPNFQPGETIDGMAGSGVLHPLCSQIFRKGKTADYRYPAPPDCPDRRGLR